MYEHIKDMASSLIEAGLATDQEQIKLVLSSQVELNLKRSSV